MPQVNRRAFLGAAGATGLTGIGGCLTGSGENDDLQIGISQHLVGGAWITAFFEAGQWYAEAQGIEYDTRTHDQDTGEQIQDIREFAAQDYDGIVAAPFDETVDDAIEDVVDDGVPVFTANDPGTTSAISAHVAFDNYLAGEQCAELMIEGLEEAHPDREEYEVVHVRGDFNQASNARTDGFVDLIEETDHVEVIETLQTDWSEDDAQQTLGNWINSNDPPDGIYSSNMTSGLGTYSALERNDLAQPFGHDDHIVLTQPDGGPRVHPLIADEYIYAAVDQPNYYYIPLAIRMLLNYLEDGEESLPEPGTQIDDNDLSIEPQEIDDLGQELWTDPIWAPANVEERDGHPHVLTNSITITPENVDNPQFWGNIWSDE